MVLAPEHELVTEALDRPEVAAYVEQTRRKSEMERTEESRPKEGVFSGLTARNPASGKEVPMLSKPEESLKWNARRSRARKKGCSAA